MKLFRSFFALAFVMLVGASAQALVIDADGFSNEQNISNAFPGVTLSTVAFGNSAPVLALSRAEASTGNNVFGRKPFFASPSFTLNPVTGVRTAPQIPLMAVFADLTDKVSIDVIAVNADARTGTLAAFNSSGTEIGRATSQALVSGEVETITFAVPTSEIKSIRFGSTGSFGIAADNLRSGADVVPEPASLALMGAGGLLIAGRRRKQLAA